MLYIKAITAEEILNNLYKCIINSLIRDLDNKILHLFDRIKKFINNFTIMMKSIQNSFHYFLALSFLVLQTSINILKTIFILSQVLCAIFLKKVFSYLLLFFQLKCLSCKFFLLKSSCCYLIFFSSCRMKYKYAH